MKIGSKIEWWLVIDWEKTNFRSICPSFLTENGLLQPADWSGPKNTFLWNFSWACCIEQPNRIKDDWFDSQHQWILKRIRENFRETAPIFDSLFFWIHSELFSNRSAKIRWIYLHLDRILLYIFLFNLNCKCSLLRHRQ
jgi:hypothetical protein